MAPQIMVVEDESIVAFDIAQSLKTMGYDVPGVFASGEEALQNTPEMSPDLVLMDIMLAGQVDGIEAANQLQEKYNVPVVYLTAYTDENTLRRARVTEPFGYLLKPFEEIQLQTSIEMALYKHKKASLLHNANLRHQIAALYLNDGLFDYNISEDSLYFSPGCERLFNVPASEITNDPESWLKNIHEDDRQGVSDGLKQLENAVTDQFVQEFRVKQDDGCYLWVKLKAKALCGENKKPVRLIGCINDISMRRSSEESLIHYSFHDPLTDLPNRIAFIDHLGRRLRNDKVKRSGRFALFHININGFKEINQAFGYQGGDELLNRVKERLQEKMSKKAFLARLGGDNFMVMQDLRDNAHVERIIKKIHSVFEEEFTVQQDQVGISVTVGACRSDQKFSFPEEMLLEAEKALLMARDSGELFSIF